MKSVNQVKRQESLKKWLEIIKDQRASGLSALAYCKREGSTSASKMVSTNGRMSQKTCWRSRSSSSAGSRKGALSRRPNWSARCTRISQFNRELPLTEHSPVVHGQRKDPHRIEFIPAKVKVIDYYHESFQCLACRKEAFQAFLKSGNAALSNNICERAIRNFTIGRKNWLFSDSPKGAKASAAVYSIIETAKANGLNPFQYLKYLFEHLPNADIQRHPEHLDDVLPWNETIQQNCK